MLFKICVVIFFVYEIFFFARSAYVTGARSLVPSYCTMIRCFVGRGVHQLQPIFQCTCLSPIELYIVMPVFARQTEVLQCYSLLFPIPLVVCACATCSFFIFFAAADCRIKMICSRACHIHACQSCSRLSVAQSVQRSCGVSDFSESNHGQTYEPVRHSCARE